MKYKLFIILIFILPTILPTVVKGQETCSVQPYSQTLKEKGGVTFAYSLSGGGDASRLSLGGLPGGVIGSFETDNKIVLNALQGAQLGSFDVSVLYEVQDGETLIQSACSFNVRVEALIDRDTTQDYIPLPSHSEKVPSAIEQGVITAEPVSDSEEINDDTEDKIFISPLYVGVRSDEVVELQTKLKVLGYFPSWLASTGYYGEITKRAISEFQTDHNIESLGFVGPLTRAALNDF